MAALKKLLAQKNFSGLNSMSRQIQAAPKSNEILNQLIQENIGIVDTPSEQSLAITLEKLTARYLRHEAIALDLRDWRNAPWCLWNEMDFFSNAEFAQDYLERLTTHKKRTEVNALISSYFLHFDPSHKDTRIIAEILCKIIPLDPRLEKWKVKHRELKVFSPDEAPSHMASILIKEKRPIKTVFTDHDIFIETDYRYIGFVSAIYAAFCENAKQGVASAKLTELLEWSMLDNNLRYPQHRAKLVDAVLLPWVGGPPPQQLKDLLFNFILKLFKDPRIHSAAWTGSHPKSKEIFISWLTERTLEQFFNVVDQVAPEDHWAYRRKFWEAYKDKNMQVWVVFGPACASKSQEIYGKELSFARFSDISGITKEHACLIIQLGNLIITEWSHNGACRIWPHDKLSVAPEPFRTHYSPDLLKTISQYEDGWFRHSGSETYNWQKRIASYIHQHTNISVNQHEYRL